MLGEKERRKWKVSDIGVWLKDALVAILHGDLLLRLQAHKYFIHIAYTFLLFFLSIWLGIHVERTLTRVERNREILSDIEIYHAQKTIELASLGRMDTVQSMLKEQGSSVGPPTKPADRIVK